MPQFPGELQHEVAAHGVADQSDGLQRMSGDEVMHHVIDIGGHAGVIERGGEALRAAAVAHVHANDIAAGMPKLICIPDDVLRAR